MVSDNHLKNLNYVPGSLFGIQMQIQIMENLALL